MEPLPRIFVKKLIQVDKYGLPLSIDAKNVDFLSQWRFKDVMITNIRFYPILQFLLKTDQIFKFKPKIPMNVSLMKFLSKICMKENGYFITH